METSQSGYSYGSFSVAVNTYGNKEQGPIWIRVIVMGRLLKYAQQVVSKGAVIAASGNASLSQYTDRSGAPKIGIQIQASSLAGMNHKRNDGGRNDEDEVPF